LTVDSWWFCVRDWGIVEALFLIGCWAQPKYLIRKKRLPKARPLG